MRPKAFTVRLRLLDDRYRIDGWFILAYEFLDPAREGSLLAAYIVGIAIGCCLVFCIVKGICLLRRHLSFRYGRFEDPHDPEALDEWQDVAVPKEASVSEA